MKMLRNGFVFEPANWFSGNSPFCFLPSPPWAASASGHLLSTHQTKTITTQDYHSIGRRILAHAGYAVRTSLKTLAKIRAQETTPLGNTPLGSTPFPHG